MRFAIVASLILSFARHAPAAESGKVSKESLTSEGKTRTYFLFVPPGAMRDAKAPLIVTLHGSGRNGESLVAKWKDLAAKETIILAGPDSLDSVHWNSPADGPVFLRDLVESLKARLPIDGRRVYLFGHSAGAGFALQMAALESEYFAAAAIHAGALDPDFFSVFDYAVRKIPYAIWIGTRDAFFPLNQVRATRDALKTRGFPVEYTEIPGHTHDYYGSSSEINKGAWEFLRKQSLPADPKYKEYQVN